MELRLLSALGKHGLILGVRGHLLDISSERPGGVSLVEALGGVCVSFCAPESRGAVWPFTVSSMESSPACSFQGQPPHRAQWEAGCSLSGVLVEDGSHGVLSSLFYLLKFLINLFTQLWEVGPGAPRDVHAVDGSVLRVQKEFLQNPQHFSVFARLHLPRALPR